MMKILFVITGLGVGGAEAVVTNLADELASRGHEVCIAYLTGEACVLPKTNSIPIVSLKLNSLISFPKALLDLRGLISQFKPDVVHSHMFHSNVLSRLARLTTNFPRLICTAHSNNEGGKSRMFIYRLTNFLGDVFTNVSLSAVSAFEKNGAVVKGGMIAVLNGIDSARFSPDPIRRKLYRDEFNLGSNKVIIAVGRLYEPKDYPNLLVAFSEIADNQKNIKLLIVGEGPLRSVLQEQVDKLRLSEKVIFLGVRQDVPDLLRAADIFVLSSAWEGFALVVGEAMATGLTVVATDCGGVAEVLGNTGYLVPAKDAAKLSKGLQKAILLSSEEAKEIGTNARTRIILNNSMSATVARWLDIYQDSAK